MELRPELTAPPISVARAQRIREMIEEIEEELESNGTASELVRAFNQYTGRDFDEDYFRFYWEGTDLDNFVRQGSRSTPRRVPDVTRDELIEIVRRALPDSENPDYEYYAEIFEANVAKPSASSLIYGPDCYNAQRDSLGDYNPTPEEIVDIALAYKIVALPSLQ